MWGAALAPQHLLHPAALSWQGRDRLRTDRSRPRGQWELKAEQDCRPGPPAGLHRELGGAPGWGSRCCQPRTVISNSPQILVVPQGSAAFALGRRAPTLTQGTWLSQGTVQGGCENRTTSSKDSPPQGAAGVPGQCVRQPGDRAELLRGHPGPLVSQSSGLAEQRKAQGFWSLRI